MRSISENRFLRRTCVAISGLLVPFGFAPFGLYFLPILSLAILFYFWINAESTREGFILGYLFGFTMFGVGINWLHISINLFGGVNLIGALFFTYCLVAFIALYPALCGYLCCRFFKQHRYIVFAPIWLITEWCRGWLLTGFPWLNIGTSQTDSILKNLIPVIGDYGLSFIVAIIATAFVILITGKVKLRSISVTILLFIIITSLLLNKTSWNDATGEHIDVALIQGAIPQELKWRAEMRQRTFDIYTELSEPYWNGDLIIWPETAIPSLYHNAKDFIGPITERKQNTDTLFMSGLAYKDHDTDKYFNSILLINDEHHFYHKHHLVPFGEYLPLKPLLGGILSFLKIPMSDFSTGDAKQKLFKTDKGIFGMSICYEDAYGVEIRRALPDANVLINVSNDAWFGDSFAPHQHLQIARMRALESGRYLLRATNTGISAVIDDKGKLVDRSPQFEPHALQARVTLFQGATPYSRYGNTLILIIAILLLITAWLLEKRMRIKT